MSPSVKPMCEKCKVIRRHGVVRVICTASKRHKQRQGLRGKPWHESPGSTFPGRSGWRISLTYIFRRGSAPPPLADSEATGIDLNTCVLDLIDEEVARLRTWIDSNVKVEGDLRRDIQQDIKRKMEIGSYQGIRHRSSACSGARPAHPATNARDPQVGPKKTRRRQEEGQH